MTFKYFSRTHNFIRYCYYRNEKELTIWIRICGKGLALKNSKKLFSERNGYVKSIPVGFGFRIVRLRDV